MVIHKISFADNAKRIALLIWMSIFIATYSFNAQELLKKRIRITPFGFSISDQPGFNLGINYERFIIKIIT